MCLVHQYRKPGTDIIVQAPLSRPWCKSGRRYKVFVKLRYGGYRSPYQDTTRAYEPHEWVECNFSDPTHYGFHVFVDLAAARAFAGFLEADHDDEAVVCEVKVNGFLRSGYNEIGTLIDLVEYSRGERWARIKIHRILT